MSSDISEAVNPSFRFEDKRGITRLHLYVSSGNLNFHFWTSKWVSKTAANLHWLLGIANTRVQIIRDLAQSWRQTGPRQELGIVGKQGVVRTYRTQRRVGAVELPEHTRVCISYLDDGPHFQRITQ